MYGNSRILYSGERLEGVVVLTPVLVRKSEVNINLNP